MIIGVWSIIPTKEPLWDDTIIREKCQQGTTRERDAYIDAGYILKPEMISIDQVEGLDGESDFSLTTMREVALAMCKKYEITMAQLMAHNRTPKPARARREAYYLCAVKLGKSTPQIARFFKRDHSTVVYHLHWHQGRPKKRYMPGEYALRVQANLAAFD